MLSTDNFKALARKFEISVKEVRDLARMQGLQFSYSPERRTWFLDESAAEIVKFNKFLANVDS